jgi:hypothetical protein
MEDKTYIALFGIGCMTALEVSAVMSGNDGAYLSAVIAAISVVVGYAFGSVTGDKAGYARCIGEQAAK